MDNKEQELPINVAYAEDHHTVRTTVKEYLENLGGIKIIIEAENGRELIDKIERSDIKPDVCMVDIMMPTLNGFDTVSIIRQKWNDMRILVLSGYILEEFMIKMILAGADGFLSKKENPKEIKKAIVALHEYGLYNSNFFTPKFISDVRSKKIEVPNVTGTELQLLKYSIEDKTYDEIAVLMNLTPKSVEGHRNRLFAKLGIKTRAGLIMYAIRYGHVAIDPGISPV